MELKEITTPLLNWYQKSKRSLPWREEKNIYHTWISEIMLQQTRVEAVKEYYLRFIKEIPDIKTLSEIEEDKLLKLWEGLGYYSRAKNLQKTAKIIMEQYNGIFPNTYEEIINLPGIGKYTAGAILSIRYDKPYPAIDGNVMRILARLTECEFDISENKTKEYFEELLLPIMPKKAGDFNQAFMDLGSSICLPNTEPLCKSCPLKKICKAYLNQTTSQYPIKKKKVKRKIENRIVLLFSFQNEILIHKRKSEGLLANLYEFYQKEGNYSLKEIENFLKIENIDYKEIYPIGEAKHIFSHIEWHMNGFFIELNKKITPEDYFWCPISSLEKEYCIPTAFRYYKKYLLFEKENKLI